MSNPTKDEKKYVFSGKVVRNVFNSPDYKIYALNVDLNKYPEIKINNYGNVSITGELPDLIDNAEYEITAIEQDSKFGTGYKVLNIRKAALTSEEDMFVFLEEILTENQAKVLWEYYPDIVQRVKEKRLDDIDLKKLKGINEYTFEKIKQKIEDNFCLSDLVIEFKGFLTLSIIRKIYNKYTSIEVLKRKLKENPYNCLCRLASVGFKTADEILLNIEKASRSNLSNGKPPIIDFEFDLLTSKERCLSCVLHLLNENENNGHTKMNLVDLRKECMKIVPECIHYFSEAINSKMIYYNKESLNVSLKRTYEIEHKIASVIIGCIVSDKINNKKCWNFDVEKYRKMDDCTLSDEQVQAIKNVCQNTISILNGAAGCGKSMSVKALVKMLEDNKKTYRLFTPTGKSSKVLSGFTGKEATTIHRGLGYNPGSNPPWTVNKDNQLKTDIVIIDEFSMVDIHLFDKVIDAIDFEHTKLLLIGDNAQLCAVGCGNLLHDFMQVGLIATTTLTKVFRYDEGGLMKVATDTRFCKPYLDMAMKSKVTSFGDNKDYVFIDLASDSIPEYAVALYKKLLDNNNTIKDIHVLTSKNVGSCGAVSLNHLIQKVANPNYGSELCMKSGETTYYRGDLVIQKVNNYKAQTVEKDDIDNKVNISNTEITSCESNNNKALIANGEVGIIEAICNTYMIINFDGVYVKYSKSDLSQITLGYAMTIHKSQGSSINNVIVCTPQSHMFMLNSNLIYVGLTRARKKCFHLGALNSVNKAVVKKANLQRSTFMQELLSSFLLNSEKGEQ